MIHNYVIVNWCALYKKTNYEKNYNKFLKQYLNESYLNKEDETNFSRKKCNKKY